MYLTDQIAIIDQAIINGFPKECDEPIWNVKNYGETRVMWTQNGEEYNLHYRDLDENAKDVWRKLTIDDQYDVQLMHVLTDAPRSLFVVYGGNFDFSLKVNMKLLVLTTKQSVLDRILVAFKSITDVEFTRVDADTESVMTREMKIKRGKNQNQSKNYPPEYNAYCFYYSCNTIEPNIEDEL